MRTWEKRDERKPARRGQAVNHTEAVQRGKNLDKIGVDLLEDDEISASTYIESG